MIDKAISLCMWLDGRGAYGLHFAPLPLGLILNMCPCTNINVMHDLKVNHTLLATCSYIEPFS